LKLTDYWIAFADRRPLAAIYVQAQDSRYLRFHRLDLCVAENRAEDVSA